MGSTRLYGFVRACVRACVPRCRSCPPLKLHGAVGFDVDDGLATGDSMCRKAMPRVADRSSLGKRLESPLPLQVTAERAAQSFREERDSARQQLQAAEAATAQATRWMSVDKTVGAKKRIACMIHFCF